MFSLTVLSSADSDGSVSRTRVLTVPKQPLLTLYVKRTRSNSPFARRRRRLAIPKRREARALLQTSLVLHRRRSKTLFLAGNDLYTTSAALSLSPSLELKLAPRENQARVLVDCQCNIARERPIGNSYWATQYLVACEFPYNPAHEKQTFEKLINAGVRTFIDLTEEGELVPYKEPLMEYARKKELDRDSDKDRIEYYRFPIPDHEVVDDETLSGIFSVLRDCVEHKRLAAVHCRGGIGRTGTVVGCWLVECGAVCNGEEALRMIADEWITVKKSDRYKHSPETDAQRQFVQNYTRLMPSSSPSKSNSVTDLVGSN